MMVDNMYHYTDGNLRDVWLVNGYTTHETPYGKGVSFHNLDGLTRAICLALIAKPRKLSGVEFRYIRQNMLLSQASLAKMLGCTEQSVSLWERHGNVPKLADKMLRIMYTAHVQGNTTVREAIERLNVVDRLINPRIVLQETESGQWQSRAEEQAVTA
jgi:putative transcriptional regulator